MADHHEAPSTSNLHGVSSNPIKKTKGFAPSIFFTCAPCGFLSNNQVEYKTHLQTEDHQLLVKKKLPSDSEHLAPKEEVKKALPQTSCKICNLTFYTEDLLQKHFKGLGHKKNVGRIKKKFDGGLNVFTERPVTKDELEKHRGKPAVIPTLGELDKRCELCQVWCNGPSSWMLHLDGNKHQRNVLRNLEPGYVFVPETGRVVLKKEIEDEE